MSSKRMDFILRNPLYVVFLIACVFVVIMVIKQALSDDTDQDSSSDDDNGGVFPEEPELDLPPGVTLPQKKEELVCH